MEKIAENLYRWTDSCNVHVVKRGRAAVLMDFGEGRVLDHLNGIGVDRVEWVLFTHHHREQCLNVPRLRACGAQVAVPAAERALFEKPGSFRFMRQSLNDAHTVYGASYVRPPLEAVQVDRAFGKMDVFAWEGLEFRCVETPGNSPGGMSYIVDLPGDAGRCAFSGEVMLDGARMHNWFDTEWDYGFGKGLYAIHNSAALLRDFRPAMLLPGQGPVIRDPGPQIESYLQKLRTLEKHFLRGYELFRFAGADQDKVSVPTAVPHVWQVLPHLFKFKGPDYWPNFSLVLSESGHGLVIDCGLLDRDFLDRSIGLMQQRLGLKKIDAVIVTHMHGDHGLEAGHLKEKWGAEIWTTRRVADLLEEPERYNYCAMMNSYRKDLPRLPVDRILEEGGVVNWREYAFACDWMPGQTAFHLCLHGVIDGRTVAFTGDNLFGSTTDPAQSGHEAVVSRNSAIVEEGYLYAAEYLHTIQPDLVVGGHSWVLENPAEMIGRYRQGAEDLRRAFAALMPGADYRYGFDPFWVRADPYRLRVKPGETVALQVHVRNFRQRPEGHEIRLLLSPGLEAEPAVLRGVLEAEARGVHVVKIRAAADAPPGIRQVVFDVSLAGVRIGPWFDAVCEVAAS